MNNEIETVRMTLKDARKLGIRWGEICEITGGNEWAVNEGMLDEDDFIDVPIILIKK